MIANSLPSSLVDNPLLSDWIAFPKPGHVRVGTGRVEIGQGVLTALTQLAAEELGVDFAQVDLVSGQTNISPSEGWTSGSYSMSVGGRSLQIVCAEVKALFVTHIAKKLNCDEQTIGVRGGRFYQDGKDIGQDYWTLTGEIPLEAKLSGNAKLKDPAEYVVVGTSHERIDLPEKILGAAFIHDLAPPDCLHARILRQPYWGAELVELDLRSVQKRVEGQFEMVRTGNFVAFVAESEYVAARAVEEARTKARWDGGDKVPDNFGTPEWLRSQPAKRRDIASASGAGKGVSHTVEATFWRPFTTYASIGPSCALAQFQDGALTVWSHTQGPNVQRDWLAKALGLARENVTVLHRHGAGAYGMNTADDAAFDAAYIATQMPGRPIRVQWDRHDEFSSAPTSPAMLVDLRVGVGPDGKPRDWSTEIWSPPHSGRPGMNGDCNMLGAYALPDTPPLHPRGDAPESAGGGATRGAEPLYDLPDFQLTHNLIQDLPVRTASLRGLGYWMNVYANESMVDDLADRAGVDPVAFRLSILSDPRGRKVIETVADQCNWNENQAHGETCLGIGFARYKNIAAYCAVVVEVAVDEDITLKRVWCATDAGLVINPDGVLNQIEGGIIHGASFVLREAIQFEDGWISTESFSEYPILRFSDIPQIDVKLIDNPRELPLGVGECAVGPIAAAIGNAVSRSLGTRLRTMPLNRDNIMEALLQAD